MSQLIRSSHLPDLAQADARFRLLVSGGEALRSWHRLPTGRPCHQTSGHPDDRSLKYECRTPPIMVGYQDARQAS